MRSLPNSSVTVCISFCCVFMTTLCFWIVDFCFEMFVCKTVDGEEVWRRRQFTYPELLDLSFFVVLEFVHILLKLLYLSLGSDLFLLGHPHSFLEIFDGPFGHFDVISDLHFVD